MLSLTIKEEDLAHSVCQPRLAASGLVRPANQLQYARSCTYWAFLPLPRDHRHRSQGSDEAAKVKEPKGIYLPGSITYQEDTSSQAKGSHSLKRGIVELFCIQLHASLEANRHIIIACILSQVSSATSHNLTLYHYTGMSISTTIISQSIADPGWKEAASSSITVPTNGSKSPAKHHKFLRSPTPHSMISSVSAFAG